MPRNTQTTQKIQTRVYKYGLILKEEFPEEAANELKKMNALWNKLVELHRDNAELFTILRGDKHPEFRDALEEYETISTQIKEKYNKIKTGGKNHPKNEKHLECIKELKKQRKQFYDEVVKPLRQQADRLIDTKALEEDFKQKRDAAYLKKNNGQLYSKNAGAVKKYFVDARKKVLDDWANGRRTDLRYHPLDGSGYFHFRFRRSGATSDGVSLHNIFASGIDADKPRNMNSRRFVFKSIYKTHRKPRKKPRIKLQAILAGTHKSAVRCQFDMIYHRCIPENGQIRDAKILRRRIGNRFKYEVAFTVRLPAPTPIAQKPDRVIGIDLGFRQSENNNGLEVASIISTNRLAITSDSDFTKKVLFIPDKIANAISFIENIQTALDDDATELGKDIIPVFKKHPLDERHPKYKLWKSVGKLPENGTLSFETAGKLARWMESPYYQDEFPETTSEKIVKWWNSASDRYNKLVKTPDFRGKTTRRKAHQELHNLRTKALAHRKDFYRNQAFSLVREHIPIILEKLDLKAMAEHKQADNKLGSKARAQRFDAALSEFRNAIKNAAERDGVQIVEVPAYFTSKTCSNSNCGKLNKELTSEKKWVCPSCKTEHDRDINAAINIARKGIEKIR